MWAAARQLAYMPLHTAATAYIEPANQPFLHNLSNGWKNRRGLRYNAATGEQDIHCDGT